MTSLVAIIPVIAPVAQHVLKIFLSPHHLASPPKKPDEVITTSRGMGK